MIKVWAWANLALSVTTSQLLASQSYLAKQVALPVTLTIPAKVETKSANLYIGSLVSCQGTFHICQELNDISLKPSPYPGRQIEVSRQEIVSALKIEFPKIRVGFTGANKVVVRARKFEVENKEIQAALSQFLEERTSSSDKFVVKKTYLRGRKYTRYGERSWSFPNWSKIKGDLLSRSKMTYDLEALLTISHDGEVSQQVIPIRVIFEHRHYVPVTRERFTPGKFVTKGDLVSDWVVYHRDHIADYDQILGRRTRRGLNANKAFKSNFLVEPTSLRRGQAVDVILISSGIRVKSRGKAMTKGQLGDEIAVSLTNSKKTVQAKVVGSNLVEVKL